MHIRPFEIALIGVFALAGIFGVFFLSSYQAEKTTDEKIYGERVTIWGTLDGKTMSDLILQFSRANKALEVVKYKEIAPDVFEHTLLNAIADGQSPDLIILPHTLLATYSSKLQAISYEAYSERTFRDTYIDGAEIFLGTVGVYGLPFGVDPLVMYWNRDIFSTSGLSQPPKTWETLMTQTTPAIVQTSDNLGINQSAVALGEYANINHAKEILSMLFFQAGTGIVEQQGTSYRVTLGNALTTGLSAGEAAITFYTQFADANTELYSWNRSKGLDRTEFLNGDLALYFGLGSENQELERENPNLNFDIAPVPQGSAATVQRNYGDFYAFAIPRASQNIQGAYAVASYIGAPANAKALIDAYQFAPVHRILYQGAVGDPFRNVVYQAGLTARGWLDPSPEKSDAIFRQMVETVATGRTRINGIIVDAVYQLGSLF